MRFGADIGCAARAIPVRDERLLARIREQASRIGLKAAPVVAYCERVTIPVVAGVLRPMILLPIWLATEMDTEQVLVILAHEMVTFGASICS